MVPGPALPVCGFIDKTNTSLTQVKNSSEIDKLEIPAPATHISPVQLIQEVEI